MHYNYKYYNNILESYNNQNDKRINSLPFQPVTININTKWVINPNLTYVNNIYLWKEKKCS